MLQGRGKEGKKTTTMMDPKAKKMGKAMRGQRRKVPLYATLSSRDVSLCVTEIIYAHPGEGTLTCISFLFFFFLYISQSFTPFVLFPYLNASCASFYVLAL
jgi:hypothetical protein